MGVEKATDKALTGQSKADRAMMTPQQRLLQWYKPDSKVQRPFANGLKDVPYSKKPDKNDPSVRALLEQIKIVEYKNGFPSGTIVLTSGAVRKLLMGNYDLSKTISDADILIRAKHGNPMIEHNGRRIIEALKKGLGQQSGNFGSVNSLNTIHWNGFTLDYMGYYDPDTLEVYLRDSIATKEVEPFSMMWIDTLANVYDPYGGIKDLMIDKVVRWEPRQKGADFDTLITYGESS